MICLASLDKLTTCTSEGVKPKSLKDFYFPKAKETDHFYQLTDMYWDAFNKVRIDYSIGIEDIPMEFVIGSFRILLGCYGNLAENSVVWPGFDEIYNSIIRSGYTESDDVHVKPPSKRKNRR